METENIILHIEGEDCTYAQFVESNAGQLSEEQWESVWNLEVGDSVFIGVCEVKRVA